MDLKELETLVDNLYASSAAGDWDKVSTMVTDDLLITEAPGLPMAGEFRGPFALRDLFNEVFAMLKVESLDVLGTTYGDGWAIKILRMNFGRGLASAELCEALRIRDGKVCEIKPFYFDPAPVIAAAAANQEA